MAHDTLRTGITKDQLITIFIDHVFDCELLTAIRTTKGRLPLREYLQTCGDFIYHRILLTLGGSELERRWNEKLEDLERVRGTLTELEHSRRHATTQERERLMTLGRNFGEVWNDPVCPRELKKKIVRTLVEEVLVDEDPPGKLTFIIDFNNFVEPSPYSSSRFELPYIMPTPYHKKGCSR